MKRLNRICVFGLGVALIVAIFGLPLLANAQGSTTTTFTYQGRLLRGSDYVDNVNCNFRFGLYGALSGGTPLGSVQAINNVPVSDGYFTVNLDFGDQFNGDLRYLETEVQCPGDAGFATLTPRVILYAAPYAHSAARVPWTGISSMPAGFADGSDDGQAYTAGIGITIGSSNVISATFAGSGSAGTVARSDHNHDTVYLNAGDAADGDLAGTYPNPTVDGLQGRPVAAVAPTSGQILEWNGSTWAPATDDSAAYTAGAGLNLTGAQFSITPTYRLPQSCANNQTAKWNSATNTWACANDTDTDTTYTAGNGLALLGTQFNLALTHSLPQGCSSDQTAKWDGATNTWYCADDTDTDTDTTYTAGDGLFLAGTEFNLAPAYSLPQTCSLNQTAKWNGTAWGCAADDDTTYGPGTGLAEAGNLFSLISTYRLPQTCTDNQTAKWDDDTNVWYCSNDSDTPYTAGTGLNLSGTQFSITTTYQLPQTCTAGQTTQWDNLNRLWICANDNSGTTYTAGDGLDLASGAFSVDVTDLIGTGLAEDASNNLTVDFGTGTNQAARGDHTHTIGGDLSGTLANLQIVANAVGSAEIADNAVGSTEIASDAVGAAEIATDAVGSAEIVADAVGSAEIASDAVGSAEIATNAVNMSEINATMGSGNDYDYASHRVANYANYLFPASSFTPEAGGQCLVIATVDVSSGGTQNRYGAWVRTAKRTGVDSYGNHQVYMATSNSDGQILSTTVTEVMSVTGGEATRFGCYIYVSNDGSWTDDEYWTCNVSYLCQ